MVSKNILFCLTMLYVSFVVGQQHPVYMGDMASTELLDGFKSDPGHVAVVSPVGFYVKGGLGIHSDAMLVVSTSRVYLDQAVVVGEGELRLSSSKDQFVWSEGSSVNNLVIDSDATVLLAGDLTIDGQISFVKGVLDASVANKLDFGDKDVSVYIESDLIIMPASKQIVSRELGCLHLKFPSFVAKLELISHDALGYRELLAFKNISCYGKLKMMIHTLDVEDPPPRFAILIYVV